MKSYSVKYKIFYYLFETLRWIAILFPFVFLIIKNKEEYFLGIQSQNKYTLGAGIAMLIVIGVWVILRELRRKKERSIAVSPLMGVIMWYGAWQISVFLQSILYDLPTILKYAFIGQLAGLLFELVAKELHRKWHLYEGAEINANTHERARNSHKQETIPYE